MIEILQEITDWGKYPVANGVYHVNSAGQLVQHNDKVFKNPIKQFSKARRKFTKIGERPEELAHARVAAEAEGAAARPAKACDAASPQHEHAAID